MLTCPTISTPHGFFDRANGISQGVYQGLNCGPGSDDDPANIAENRRIAASIISGRRDSHLISLYQVHSSKALYVTEDWGDDRPQGDAMVTDKPGLILGILTADCCPVLFHDQKAGIIGAAHAGWRGAKDGILQSTIEMMCNMGSSPQTIRTAIGPTITQVSYEVGLDFKSQLVTTDLRSAPFFRTGKRPDHFQFNLPGYVSDILKRCGISQIWNAHQNTYASEQYFSYRRTTHRQEKDYGRQLSAIMIRGGR